MKRAKGTEVFVPTLYLFPIPFRCSADCGDPIRQGQEFVQTSPDWKPLERAHAGCLRPRTLADLLRKPTFAKP